MGVEAVEWLTRSTMGAMVKSFIPEGGESWRGNERQRVLTCSHLEQSGSGEPVDRWA
jgi:hypothetical protein